MAAPCACMVPPNPRCRRDSRDDSARLSSASCSRIPGEGMAAETSRSRGTALAGGGSGKRRANSVGCLSQLFAFGVEPRQAETHGEAICDAMAESAATKAEVTGLETRMAELKDLAVRHVRHGRIVLRCAQGIRRGRIATAPRPQLFPSFPGPHAVQMHARRRRADFRHAAAKIPFRLRQPAPSTAALGDGCPEPRGTSEIPPARAASPTSRSALYQTYY